MTNQPSGGFLSEEARRSLYSDEVNRRFQEENRGSDLSPLGVARAINQLACVVGGRDYALQTNSLIEDPFARLESMTCLAADDLINAAQHGDTKALNQAQRKSQSLASLDVLAQVIRIGVDWDAVSAAMRL